MAEDRTSVSTRKALFVHIPKCAGQSLIELVRKQFFPPNSGYLYIGGPADIGKLVAMSPKELATNDFIAGHIPLNVIRNFLDREFDPYFTFTVLRDPVERARSLYKYIRAMPGHFQHAKVSTQSLIEFVRSEQHQKNFQCHMIKTGADAAEAISYARRFVHHVGTVDDMPGVAAALRRHFLTEDGQELPQEEVPHVNATDRDSVNELDLRNVIHELDREDVALYRYFSEDHGSRSASPLALEHAVLTDDPVLAAYIRMEAGSGRQGTLGTESAVVWSSILHAQSHAGIEGGLVEIDAAPGIVAALLSSHLRGSERLLTIDGKGRSNNDWWTAAMELAGAQVVRQIRQFKWNGSGPVPGELRIYARDNRFVHICCPTSYEHALQALRFASGALSEDGVIVIDGFFDVDATFATQALFDFATENSDVFSIFLAAFGKAYLCRRECCDFYGRITANLPAALRRRGIQCELNDTARDPSSHVRAVLSGDALAS